MKFVEVAFKHTISDPQTGAQSVTQKPMQGEPFVFVRRQRDCARSFCDRRAPDPHSIPMRMLSFLVLAVLTLTGTAAVSQKPAPPVNVPAESVIEIVLVEAPGINHAGSGWEINYEVRLATDADLWEAHRNRASRGDDTARVGELIKEGSVKQLFDSPGNRKALLRIPLNQEIQGRLRNQPPRLDQRLAAEMTLEQSREREKRAQNFMFRAVAEVYDARLGKKLIMTLVGAWPFDSFPEARFEIRIWIRADGDYKIEYLRPNGGRTLEIIK